MKDFAAAIVGFFTSLNLPSKFFTLVLSVCAIFWIDSQLGFTYHYFTDRKISHIAKYNEILRDTSIDKATRILIERQRGSVITKERAIIDLNTWFKNSDRLLFHISYSWILILLIINAYPLLRKSQPTSDVVDVKRQSAAIQIIFALEIGIAYLLALAISNFASGALMFIVNSIMQCVFLGFTFAIANSLERRKASNRLR